MYLFYNFFDIFCLLLLSPEKKVEWKRSDLKIFGDKSNLHRSFDALDVIFMMIDIGSNCHYFAHESSLKYSFEMNLVAKGKVVAIC